MFQRFTLEHDFEVTLEPWSGDGTDLDDPPVTSSVELSQERAANGVQSVRLSLDNLNDQGKIWIEQGLGQLIPGQRYQVQMSFSFASADFGSVNLWRIIAGVSQSDPENASHLTFQDETGNGAATDVGFIWLEKSYDFEVVASPTGTLWFVIGVWGTSEFNRTYYVDRVTIVVTGQ